VAAALLGSTHRLPEAAMTTRNYDDWTIDRWRLEPRLERFEIEDPPDVDPTPTLWKDLTMASAVALVIWITAALVFG
jgi:hypothetical protein